MSIEHPAGGCGTLEAMAAEALKSAQAISRKRRARPKQPRELGGQKSAGEDKVLVSTCLFPC